MCRVRTPSMANNSRKGSWEKRPVEYKEFLVRSNISEKEEVLVIMSHCVLDNPLLNDLESERFSSERISKSCRRSETTLFPRR